MAVLAFFALRPGKGWLRKYQADKAAPASSMQAPLPPDFAPSSIAGGSSRVMPVMDLAPSYVTSAGAGPAQSNMGLDSMPPLPSRMSNTATRWVAISCL